MVQERTRGCLSRARSSDILRDRQTNRDRNRQQQLLQYRELQQSAHLQNCILMAC